jgi:hypothetical protein
MTEVPIASPTAVSKQHDLSEVRAKESVLENQRSTSPEAPIGIFERKRNDEWCLTISLCGRDRLCRLGTLIGCCAVRSNDL